MRFFLLNIVTLLIASAHGTSRSLSTLKALKFPQDSKNFIQFYPDWSPFVKAISVCGWIRDTGSSQWRTIFTYNHSKRELVMLADGQYIEIFSSARHYNEKFSVPKGTWYHGCVTWSSSSRAHRYYVNGEELGSQQTPSGKVMTTGGPLTIGKWGGMDSRHEFGGEMAYLNFYAKELSASEIARMAQVGICSNIAAVDENESHRVIKWEEITKLGRSGTVIDIYVEECVDSIIEKAVALEEAERKLKDTQQKLKKKDEIAEELSAKLNSTQAELEAIYSSMNRTWDWEIFLSEDFLNQTFTREHAQLLRTSWDDVAERLVGIKITDEFLKLSAHIDRIEDRPWSMLYSENYFNEVFTQQMADRLTSIWDGISEKLVGVTMTKEVIELLDYVTDKTNCGNGGLSSGN